MFPRPHILSSLNCISENIQVTEGRMLAGPALVGTLYKLQAGKPVILHSIPSRGKGSFFLFQTVQIGFGAHPTSCLVGTGGPIPGVKSPLRDADNSHPSNVKIKTEICNILFFYPEDETKRPFQNNGTLCFKISQHLVT